MKGLTCILNQTFNNFYLDKRCLLPIIHIRNVLSAARCDALDDKLALHLACVPLITLTRLCKLRFYTADHNWQFSDECCDFSSTEPKAQR